MAGCDLKDLERLSHPMRPVPLHKPVPVSEVAEVVYNVHPVSVYKMHVVKIYLSIYVCIFV